MRRSVGFGVLALSAAGFPLTELAIRGWGRRGGVLVECVCGGLLVRDAAMIACGATRRLRRIPATLLWCEAVTAGVAVATGLPPVIDAPRPRLLETARRVAVGILFGLHTVRFGIYLQPDRGLRPNLRTEVLKAGRAG